MTKTFLLSAFLFLTTTASAAELSSIDARTLAAEIASVDHYLAGLKDGSETNSSLAADEAEMCITDIEHARNDGVSMDATVEVNGAKLTLASALADHCRALDDYARTYRQRAKADLDKKLAAIGLAGDKLAFAKARHTSNDDVYLPGARLMKSDAEYAKASVFFVLSGGGEHVWTLRRYEFKGNRAVSSTAQELILRPGPSKFR